MLSKLVGLVRSVYVSDVDDSDKVRVAAASVADPVQIIISASTSRNYKPSRGPPYRAIDVERRSAVFLCAPRTTCDLL